MSKSNATSHTDTPIDAELPATFTKIAVWSALIGTAIFFAYMLSFMHDQNKKVDALKAGGQKSLAHQFVVDKYLACRAELFSPSRDECVTRVMVLARVQGVEFESRTGDAILDLGLNK